MNVPAGHLKIRSDESPANFAARRNLNQSTSSGEQPPKKVQSADYENLLQNNLVLADSVGRMFMVSPN
jgi:hypothetical protein